MCDYNQDILSYEKKPPTNQRLSPDLAKSINKIIENEGYIKHSIYVRDISTDGGNYLSVLKEVVIKGKTAKNDKETNLFIKLCLPEGDQNVFAAEELFFNEIFVYTEVAEMFNELQNEFNVPGNERFHFVKYYDSGNNKSLILENMTRRGFKVYDRFDAPPLKIIERSIKQLAIFHGLSMVLKQYRPHFYKNKIQILKHPFKIVENHKIFMTSLVDISVKYLEDDKKVKSLENLLPEMHKKFHDYVNKNESTTKCLCYGDYRMNNILLKDKNGEEAQLIPVDYQSIHYGCPVVDLIYFIFLTTDRNTRGDMKNLKNTYFESLSKLLKYFNINVESVYPRKDFEDDFKNQLEYGLIVSLFLLPFVLASEDEFPEVTLEMKTVKMHDNFKIRINEVVDDYIVWGYL